MFLVYMNIHSGDKVIIEGRIMIFKLSIVQNLNVLETDHPGSLLITGVLITCYSVCLRVVRCVFS